MSVKSILALKGREVATASPDQSLHSICERLSELRIGAIVVVEGSGEVAGIVSERDVVRAIARHGVDVLKEPAGRFMTRNVVTCSEQDTMESVMDKMTRGRFRHLPVITGGRLAGIISIGDVVKNRMAEIEREANEIRQYIATA